MKTMLKIFGDENIADALNPLLLELLRSELPNGPIVVTVTAETVEP